ncbi:MAG TPA: SDR family oxidoreductase [Bacteroidales bacterium]
MQFNNKIVWITGASSGIGEELAYQCVSKKATVILSSANVSGLEVVKKKCENLGGKAFVVPFDLSKPKEIDDAVVNALQLHGKIDVLINNGGISQRATIEDTTTEMDRKIMEINFFGTIYLTKKVLPKMIESGGGIFAVTSSFTGKFGFPLRSAYSASKHALHGFFETLRLEYQKDNIQVTMICPGLINTNISFKALAKDGRLHGKMDENQEKGMPVKKCAQLYLRAIEQNRKEVFIGKSDKIVVYLKLFFPALFYKIIGKIKPT